MSASHLLGLQGPQQTPACKVVIMLLLPPKYLFSIEIEISAIELKVNFYYTCCKNAKQHIPNLANATHIVLLGPALSRKYQTMVIDSALWVYSINIGLHTYFFPSYFYLKFSSKKEKCLGMVYYLQIKETF